jgi:hypothetical protein
MNLPRKHERIETRKLKKFHHKGTKIEKVTTKNFFFVNFVSHARHRPPEADSGEAGGFVVKET